MNKLLLGKACIAIASVMTTGLNAAEAIRYVPGEIIVKFKPGVSSRNFLKNVGITSLGLAPKREIKLSYHSLNVLSVQNEK